MGLYTGINEAVRIVPHGYGRRDDDDDPIDDLGSPEPPPSGASPALVRAEASESAADDRQHATRFETRDDFTADALAALAKLDDHGHDQIPLMLKFGEALVKARKRLEHGQFSNWCTSTLQRSPSWCSSHRRLFECGEDLRPALAWAAANHKWANCRSVERLLKIAADWKKATRGDGATAPRARPRSKPMTLRTAKKIIGELHKALQEAKAEFIALRDPLPADVAAKAAELSALAAADDVAANDELAALARRYHWRFPDLVADSCSALQVCPHSESAHPSPAVTDADESDEGSAA
jgi:hypothetical protein